MGSKARESVKAMSLAFVLLDFQHSCVSRMESSMHENSSTKTLKRTVICNSDIGKNDIVSHRPYRMNQRLFQVPDEVTWVL